MDALNWSSDSRDICNKNLFQINTLHLCVFFLIKEEYCTNSFYRNIMQHYTY